MRLVRDGNVLQAHDAMVVRWRAELGDGRTTGRGVNYGRLTADGTLAAVDGFWDL